MNQPFFWLTVLSLVLWGHAAYIWKQAGGKAVETTKARRALLMCTAAAWAVCLAVGIVGMACKLDSAMVYAMGLIALVLSLWGNGQMRRICDK